MDVLTNRIGFSTVAIVFRTGLKILDINVGDTTISIKVAIALITIDPSASFNRL